MRKPVDVDETLAAALEALEDTGSLDEQVESIVTDYVQAEKTLLARLQSGELSLPLSDEELEKHWDSIRNNPFLAPSPAWHKEVLAERERAHREGKSRFFPPSEMWERLLKLP